MDACIVTSGTGNAFPKDTGNSQGTGGATRSLPSSCSTQMVLACSLISGAARRVGQSQKQHAEASCFSARRKRAPPV
jgi:hypothetical protein